ncbi:SseB family protein [Flavihumibacter sp. UBA7668]|uniref:SseB family protein n=1 Tax=Flavihumibacter sp. UBA7668 TaxID=1946542 RepID=UPI0025C4F05F|nr:SseB family protein [Flavihumibacter sp. UBA7668]
MGIFDIFKKKVKSTFPENELEQCLTDAESDVTARKDFYQKLLWNQLYVLTGDSANAEGNNTDEMYTNIQFVVLQDGKIPVFTSTNRIFDNTVIKEKVPFVSLKGQDLFEAAKGATFIINPFSNYAKELIPEEIESLMNGTIYDQIEKNENQNLKHKEFNEIFERAGKKQKGLIFLDGYKRRSISSSEKLKLEESIEDYKKCLELFPHHWQSMVLIAKAYQRLERHAEALELLEAAFTIELENHTIPMEAALEAMHLKNLDKAIFYSTESLKRKPNDFVLMGNHAMNLLIAQKDTDALNTIAAAIRIQPNDSVNRNIESIVRDVIARRRKRPSFEETIQ